ncbi:glycosyltransferase family 2 protein [Halovulum sp. GXIMD14794]
MKSPGTPLLSIGLPVFNGENFLAQAIESLLSQDFQQFELIICDNASTDRTEAISRAFAERDARVRYSRNSENLGAAGNWNRVFELSSGHFFKWAAHDDMHEHRFLSSCLALLEAEPDAVLAYTRAISIDADAHRLREWSSHPDICSSDLSVRYARWLAVPTDPLPLPIFGVMRADVLRRTRGFASYPDADVALLTEMSLHGPFAEVPEPLFLQREHGGRAGPKLAGDPYSAVNFWDARTVRPLGLPHWSLLAGQVSAIFRAPLAPSQRLACLRILAGWIGRKRRLLSKDMMISLGHMPAVGPPVRRLMENMRLKAWRRQIDETLRELDATIPPDAEYLFADDSAFGSEMKEGRRMRSFVEDPDGHSVSPESDDAAIYELERSREAGITFLAIAWPCFWWMGYYKEFADYLDSTYPRVLESEQLIVFRLRDEAGSADGQGEVGENA